jgi:hypothetical protein
MTLLRKVLCAIGWHEWAIRLTSEIPHQKIPICKHCGKER